MASSVFTSRCNTAPGNPASTNQNRLANTASAPFSNMDSVAARATPLASSACVSRLTIRATCSLAKGKFCARNGAATARPWSAKLRAPITSHSPTTCNSQPAHPGSTTNSNTISNTTGVTNRHSAAAPWSTPPDASAFQRNSSHPANRPNITSGCPRRGSPTSASSKTAATAALIRETESMISVSLSGIDAGQCT